MRFVLFLCLLPSFCFGQIVLKGIKEYKGDSLYFGIKNNSVIPIWYQELKRDSIDYSTHTYDLVVMQPKDSLFPIAIIPIDAIKDTSEIKLKDFMN